jgi:hypothetical protein
VLNTCPSRYLYQMLRVQLYYSYEVSTWSTRCMYQVLEYIACTANILYRTNRFGVKNWHVSVGKCTLGDELLTTSGVWYNLYKEVAIGTTSRGRITLIPSSNAAFSSSILVVSERQSRRLLTQPPTKSLLDFFFKRAVPTSQTRPIICHRANHTLSCPASKKLYTHTLSMCRVVTTTSQEQNYNPARDRLQWSSFIAQGVDTTAPLVLIEIVVFCIP